MYELSYDLLSKLKCSKCSGFLRLSPVLINSDGEQFCGRCSKEIPEEDRPKFYRQIAYEIVATTLKFPCKFRELGCKEVLSWDRDENHEASCPTSLGAVVNLYEEISAPKGKEFLKESEGVLVKLRCDKVELYQNLITDEEQVRFELSIEGSADNCLALRNSERKSEKGDIGVKIESLVTLNRPPKVEFCHLALTENIKESNADNCIKPKNCCNRCLIALHEEFFHCNLGHSCCKLCRNFSCKICSFTVLFEPLRFCKNYNLGCKTAFAVSEVKKHQIDCEYNPLKCPIVPECPFEGSVFDLTGHSLKAHQSKLNCSNEISIRLSTDDKTIYFFCHQRLFVCNYYYFDDWVEFIVKYVGSNDGAKQFTYEVEVIAEFFVGNRVRKAKCLGWNGVALNKAIKYEIDDHKVGDRFRFDANLKLFKLADV